MEYLLDNTKQLERRKAEIIKEYSDQIKNINGGYTSEEAETFQYQLEEAKEYKKDNSIELYILPPIAESKGVSVLELVDIIIAKDRNYKIEVGRILAEKKKRVMSFDLALDAYHKHPLKDVHIEKGRICREKAEKKDKEMMGVMKSRRAEKNKLKEKLLKDKED